MKCWNCGKEGIIPASNEDGSHPYWWCASCKATTTSLDASSMKVDRIQPGEAGDPNAVITNGKKRGKKK